MSQYHFLGSALMSFAIKMKLKKKKIIPNVILMIFLLKITKLALFKYREDKEIIKINESNKELLKTPFL